MRAFVVVRIQLAKSLGREERLVRIETFELQQPVVLLEISLDEAQPGVERLRLVMLLLLAEELAIHPILPPHFAGTIRQRRRNLAIFHLSDPRIAFLAAKE